jgi:hypothetical protein
MCESVSQGLLLFSLCELLLLGVCSSRRGSFEIPEKVERLTLISATKQRLEKTITNQICGAEYHSRGQKLCSHSVVSQHFMEPEGSLLHSQELFTYTYPEPEKSSLFYSDL